MTTERRWDDQLRICVAPGCTTPVHDRLECAKHSWRRRTHGSYDLPPKQPTANCAVEGCDRQLYAKAVCSLHYQRIAKYGTTDIPQKEKGECLVNGCGRPVKTRGFCSAHYQRLLKHGDPLLGGRLRPRLGQDATTTERFWSHVDRTGECWLWTGALNKFGYGNFTAEGRWIGAHRYSFELANGPIPPDLTLDHVCHNADLDCEPKACLHRRCVNPEHLEAVTIAENNRRAAVMKRRQRRKASA